MPPDNAPPVVRKKVRPYPFDGELDPEAQKIQIEVIHLTAQGLIARLKSAVILSVGEYRVVGFTIPVSHSRVVAKTRVLKTYDRAVDPKVLMVERMVELRFENLTSEQKKNILSFLGAIGQK